ncbi:MAG: DUF4173 domain-containing protein [Acidimicrobiia bacterium]|nr:DUF4173 domain-containing protein [Acidimicrobiia bacterium]
MPEQDNPDDGGVTGPQLGPPPPRAKQQPTSVAERPPDPPPALPRPDPAPLLPSRVDSPTTGTGEILGVLAAGFFGNLVLRTGVVSSAAMALVILTLAVVVVSTGRIRRREPLVFLGLAAAIAPWLAIRSDNALTAMNVAMIVILLGVAAGISKRGSAFDARVRDLANHVWSPIYEWLYGLTIINRFASAATAEHKLAPFLRGAAVAVPVLIIFTTLLASADDVFAKFLLLGDLPSLIGHVILSLAVAVLLFGWVSRAAHAAPESKSPFNIRFLGPLEVTMILGSLATLFAAFVATQVVVDLGGANHVLETEGLTQAEHARAGFFQLLWVAGLSLGLVGGLRATRILEPEKGRDRFIPLALVTLFLTLLIAFVSIDRLSLYVGSFGLTPLRFWALAGAAGIALLIVAYGVSILGWRSGAQWFPGVAIVLGALFTLGLNVSNPDARVADYNMDRSTSVDVGTLSTLSDDAVETMINSIHKLNAVDRESLRSELCLRPIRQTTFGAFDYNSGRVAADGALDSFCDGGRPTESGWRGD